MMSPRKQEGAYWEFVKSVMGPLPALYGSNTVQRLIGFHVCWHLMGGWDGLKKAGWNRHQIWRNRRDFLEVFGIEVEDAFPDLAATAKALGHVGD